MPRPRKDGKPAARAQRIGKQRVTPNGRRWRARSYEPTPAAPYGRVVFYRPGAEKPTSSTPEDGKSLDETFDQIERWLDQGVAIGRSAPAPAASTADGRGERSGRRDIRALATLYLQWLEAKGNSDGYVENRRSLVRCWVLPVMGDVLVVDWNEEHSLAVLNGAREHVGHHRLEDIRSTLSGLRSTARRKRTGGRWLSPDDDPLEGVSTRGGRVRQGTSSKWVAEHRRPATDKVEKALACAAEVGRWPWLSLAISISAYCAPRLSECLALRVVDVDLDERQLDINGVWVVPPSQKKAGQQKVRVGHRRAHTKNGLRRTTPYRGSQDPDVCRAVARALGLPEDTGREVLTAAISAERDRRAALSDSGDWRDFEVPPAEEQWLWPGEDGLPPTKEQWNDAWHEVRDAADWTRTIPYRNLRHHAILWWKKNIPGVTWETLAEWSGHDVRTLHAYYEIASESATRDARPHLDRL